MATGGGDFLSELSETVLCCEICQVDFDTKTHVPRILPCYHTFCGVCVETLQRDGSLSCPNCRKIIPVEGVFPVDTTRMTILDLKQSALSKEGSRASASRRRKTSKTPEMCDQHTDEKVKLFCKPCSMSLCAMCALTMHKKCEELVDLNSIVDEKKKEMLGLCDQLDKIQEKFQEKAEESQTNKRTGESNLQAAVCKVEGVFGEIISSASERQAEVIEELRAKAKSDGLLLDEQTATFQSLQAAAQTAAEGGRECVALELAAKICSHTLELERTISDLEKKTRTPVKPSPDYQVATEKVTQLRALLKEIGGIDAEAGKLPLEQPSNQQRYFQIQGGKIKRRTPEHSQREAEPVEWRSREEQSYKTCYAAEMEERAEPSVRGAPRKAEPVEWRSREEQSYKTCYAAEMEERAEPSVRGAPRNAETVEEWCSREKPCFGTNYDAETAKKSETSDWRGRDSNGARKHRKGGIRKIAY